MAAPSQYYVDPAINDNSGTGDIGDPFGDLQYALDSVTRNATDGDQFNIKSGTDEVLAAALDFTSYGNPSTAAPIIFRGYTSVANDGGKGQINCNVTNGFIVETGKDGIIIGDLYIHNSTVLTIRTRHSCTVFNCELDSVGYEAIYLSNQSFIDNCYVHSGSGIIRVNSGLISNCFVDARGAGEAVLVASAGAAFGNLILVSGNRKGFLWTGTGASILHNSIYSENGSGIGIELTGHNATIKNNLIEGFTSGTGISVSAGLLGTVIAGNAVYNCATPYSLGKAAHHAIPHDANNQELVASPFAKSGDLTYANRYNWFAPTEAVRGIAWPTR